MVAAYGGAVPASNYREMVSGLALLKGHVTCEVLPQNLDFLNQNREKNLRANVEPQRSPGASSLEAGGSSAMAVWLGSVAGDR